MPCIVICSQKKLNIDTAKILLYLYSVSISVSISVSGSRKQCIAVNSTLCPDENDNTAHVVVTFANFVKSDRSHVVL